MNTLIIVESSHGNTAAVAAAVRDGLLETDPDGTVEVVGAADAPSAPQVDLLVLAAPTHNLGLPSPASRAKAAEGGASVAERGIREWLETCEPQATHAAAIDTKVRSGFAGSAAKKIAARLRRKGIRAQRESFVVTGTKGPLADGELDRARDLGRRLAREGRA